MKILTKADIKPQHLGPLTHDSLTVPQKAFDTDASKKALRYQFIYSVLGLILGLLFLIAGFILLLHGVAGNTKTWTASLPGFHSTASNVPAGIMLVLVGLYALYITRFKIKVTSK
jgi:hypothetical protein